MNLNEQLTFGGDGVGDIDPQISAQTAFVVDKVNIVIARRGADAFRKGFAPTVPCDLQTICRYLDRTADLEGDIAFDLHRIARPDTLLIAQHDRPFAIGQVGRQPSGIKRAVHVLETDANISRVEAVHIMVQHRHSETGAHAPQTLNGQGALIHNQLATVGSIAEFQRIGCAIQPGGHVNSDRTAQGVGCNGTCRCQADRIAHTRQGNAAIGTQGVAASGGRPCVRVHCAADHQAKVHISQCDARLRATHDTIHTGCTDQQIVRCRVDGAGQARNNIGDIDTCIRTNANQRIDTLGCRGINRDVACPVNDAARVIL